MTTMLLAMLITASGLTCVLLVALIVATRREIRELDAARRQLRAAIAEVEAYNRQRPTPIDRRNGLAPMAPRILQ